MKFHLKADIVFEAADLDDAFVKLADHLEDMAYTGHSNFEFLGDIHLEPQKED